MNNLTTLMRSMTVLLFFVMVGASTALAQNRYAERNGIGAAPCEATAPCDLEDALAAATSATDTVFVRVRESGAMTRIDADISTGTRTIGIYVEDEDDVTMGMVAIEGDVTLTDRVTVVDGTTLYLEGDVTFNGSPTDTLLTGDVQLGGSGSSMLTLGPTCGTTGGFQIVSLGVNGDIEVDMATGCANNTIRILNSLHVKDGELDLGGTTLNLNPTASTDPKVPDGRTSIAAGAMISGSEHLMLNPEAPAGGPVTGDDAKPDTLVLLGMADGTQSIAGLAEFGVDITSATFTAGNYFPSATTPGVGVVPGANDIGTVLDFRAGAAEQTGPPVVPAVQSRLRILLFVQTAGFDVTSGDCYSISGDGELQLDINKTGQGGACISVDNVGDGGTSTVSGGALILSGVSEFDGRIRNHGNARTELRNVGQISEDLEIDGEVEAVAGTAIDPNDPTTANRVGVIGSTMVRMTDCGVMNPDGTTTPADVHYRSPGVFVRGATTIVGDVILTDTNPTNDADGDADGTQGVTACAEGLYLMAPVSSSRRYIEITSSVLGALESSGSSHINLGAGAFGDFDRIHNVAFEDDVISDGDLDIGYGKAASYAVKPANLCSVNTSSATGNAVVFAGDADQDIRTTGGGTLSLDAARVDKGGDGEVLIDRGSLAVTGLLELESGMLVSDGELGLGGAVLRISGGELSRGRGDAGYTGALASLHYTGGGDLRTGDEIAAPNADGVATSFNNLEIAVDGTVTLTRPVQIAGSDGGHLFLASGMLNTTDNTVTLNRNANVHHGSGELVVGTGGSVKWPSQQVVRNSPYNPAAHGLNLFYKGTGARTVGHAWQSGMTTDLMPAEVTNVTVDASGCGRTAHSVISLNAGFSAVHGNITITQGALDIAGQHLVVLNVTGSNSVMAANKGYLCDSGAGVACMASSGSQSRTELLDEIEEGIFAMRTTKDPEVRRALQDNLATLKASWADASKSSSTSGAVHFAGNGNTSLSLGTDGKRKDAPAIIVKHFLDRSPGKTPGTVTLMSNSPKAAGTGANTKENIDTAGLVGLRHEHGNVAVASSLDMVHVATGVVQLSGNMSLASDAANLNTMDRPIAQRLAIGGHGSEGLHMVSGGSLNGMGGTISVYGHYVQGGEVMMDTTGAVIPDSSQATVNLGGGNHMVTGNFHVSFDKADDKLNVYAHGAGCGAMRDEEMAGNTTVGGNYSFAGTGECYDDDQYSAGMQGLSGSVTFNGMSAQMIAHRQNADASFGSVTVASMSMEGAGGIVLGAPATQNMHGTLTLKRGIIDTVNELFAWTMHNTMSEEDLVGSNTATMGGVMLGSRDSYINGPVTRAVAQGAAGGGVVTGGYLFPVGSANDDTTASRQVDNFRPLTLQFANDLGAASAATVDYVQQLEGIGAAVVEWPDDGLVVDAKGGGTLTLDALGNQFWLVSFDQIPAQDPNLRVAAEGLPNVFDAKGLRLVQWDCDLSNPLAPPSNPRLAGVYDLEEGPTDDKSFAVNDRINGILNLTQEGVEVSNCNVIGIAANFLQNPINMPPVSGGFAKVQYIQNVANTPVDLYMNGNRVGNDWAFQSATQFANVVGGEHTLDVVAAGDADNTNPLATLTQRFVHEGAYNVILHGDGSEVSIKVVEDVRLGAMAEDMVEFYVVHGARELGEVDIRIINPIDNTEVLDLLANNISWDDVGAYISLAPGGYNFEVTTANNDRQIDVFRLELQQFRQQAFVLNLSGSGKSSAEGVSMLGVEQDGGTFFPSVITAAETEEELPTEFALKGNYPNPFNPSTNIQIDLPEKAQVTIQIIDMLGRHVMTVPAREIEAGAKRAVEINAASLASGAYLYRVIATSASGTNIDSGRMMLIK